jgi:hypothetical protein
MVSPATAAPAMIDKAAPAVRSRRIRGFGILIFLLSYALLNLTWS